MCILWDERRTLCNSRQCSSFHSLFQSFRKRESIFLWIQLWNLILNLLNLKKDEIFAVWNKGFHVKLHLTVKRTLVDEKLKSDIFFHPENLQMHYFLHVCKEFGGRLYVHKSGMKTQILILTGVFITNYAFQIAFQIFS